MHCEVITDLSLNLGTNKDTTVHFGHHSALWVCATGAQTQTHTENQSDQVDVSTFIFRPSLRNNTNVPIRVKQSSSCALGKYIDIFPIHYLIIQHIILSAEMKRMLDGQVKTPVIFLISVIFPLKRFPSR